MKAGVIMYEIKEIKTTDPEFKEIAAKNYFHEEEMSETFADICSSDTVKIYSAFFDGEVCGFAVVDKATRDVITLLLLSVMESYRNRGIASAMLNFIVEQNKPRAVVCECTDDSLSFFEYYGFYAVTLGEKFPGKEAYYCTYRKV